MFSWCVGAAPSRQARLWHGSTIARFVGTLLILVPGGLHASPNAALHGTVRASSTTRPVDQASVSLQRTAYKAITDTTGQFRIESIEPGRYRLIVKRIGFVTLEQELDLSPGEVRSIALDLDQTVATTLQPEEVRAARGSYQITNASTATKMEVPIRDVPQAIEVRGQQVIEDLGGSHNAYEVGKTVAGVTDLTHGNSDPGVNMPNYTIRGFAGNGAQMRDGATRPNGWIYTMDMAGIDRVEFLKGPASVLYGGVGQSGSYGGAVNYVSKSPVAAPVTQVELNGGGNDFYRGSVDLGRALDSGDHLLGRMNAAISDQQSFIDREQTRTWMLAPALTFQPTTADRLTLLTEYTQTRETPDAHLPLTSDSYGVPYSRTYADPSFAHTDINALNQVGMAYQHRSSKDRSWVIEGSVGHAATDGAGNGLWFDGGGTGNWMLSGSAWKFHDTAVNLDARLEDQFTTGSIAHHGLVGINGQFDRYEVEGTFGPDVDTGTPVLVDVQSPTPGSYLDAWNASSNFSGHGNFESKSVAPYAQDLMSFGPTLKVLAGLRADLSQQSHDAYDAFSYGTPEFDHDRQSAWHVAPRLGLVWQPGKIASPYAGYSQGFYPNTGLTREHQRLDPEIGDLIEVGVKQQWGARVSANIAAYQIVQRNIEVSDPTNLPNEGYVILLGRTKSHGVELDVNGELSSQLRVNVAAALMRAWIVDSNDASAPAGNELGGSPRASVNVFGVYSFAGPLSGAELGGGATYASQMYSDAGQTLRMPAMFEIDVMAAHRFAKHYRAQLDLKNVTNRHNYSSDFGSIFRGQPFTAYLGIASRW